MSDLIENLNGNISTQAGNSLLDFNKINISSENFQYNPNDLIDPYDEDEQEQKYLSSKPTCFLIVGKPGSGKTEIAKRLAEEWKAELISSTDLIQQNIQRKTEVGKKALELLLKGDAVSGLLVAQMIDEKINSPEVIHHGYVLDGFPSQSEINFDIQKQMQLIKNWKMQPDFIINMRIPDNDLRTRRVKQKVDPVTGIIYIKDVYDPEKIVAAKKDEDDEEEEEDDYNEEEEEKEEEEAVEVDEFFTAPELEVVERLIVRPEDLEVHVNESIKTFNEAILRVIENHMSNMDQSYLVELDANLSPTVLIKQLLERLNNFIIRKATKPKRLAEAPEQLLDEDGTVAQQQLDPVDAEELLQAASILERITPKYKWRRSKWLKYCPVSLRNGTIVDGRPEYTAAFLDKVYAMSNEVYLQMFLKNPREYLKFPLPQSPCKICIIGASLTGKTTLATLLAKKYNGKVLDINMLIKNKLKETRDNLIEKTKEETIKTTIEAIKIRVREQLENERIQRERAEIEAAREAAASEEKEIVDEEGEANAGGAATAAGEVNAGEVAGGEVNEVETKEKIPDPVAEQAKNDREFSEAFVAILDDGDIAVDENHPEIYAAVEKAIADAQRKPINLPAADYVEALGQEIVRVQTERQKADPTSPSQGGWILDNFPQTTEQLSAMAENQIIPDTVIILSDNTERSYVISKRWYLNNKDEIDAKITARIKHEHEKKVEEKLRKELEKKKAAEDSDGIEEEKPKEVEEDDESAKAAKELKRTETLEKIPEEDEEHTGSKHIGTDATGSSGFKQSLETGLEHGSTHGEYFPVKGPEVEELLKTVKLETEKLKALQTAFTGVVINDPISIEVNKGVNMGIELTYKVTYKTIEEIFNESTVAIENVFKYRAADFDGAEEEEEEEEDDEEDGGEAEEEEEEEEEEDEDAVFEPTKKDENLSFGDTNHYCPISLSVKKILVPGNPEFQCKYREKIYRFSSEENRTLFMENPMKFLPSKQNPKVPPIRLVVIGPRGSGKSVQARNLAEKLDLFHFKFRDRLQEMIIGKLKKPVGPEYEEEKDQEQEEGDTDEALKQAPPELTETEEAVKNYLERDDGLTNEILDSVLGILWTEETFKSKGFVLEGFPNNDSEATYLIEKGFYPDAILLLNVSDESIIKRLLPPRLDRWKAKMEAKREKKRLQKEKKQKELKEKMRVRRMELMRDRDEKRQIREQDGEEVEDDDPEEIENALQDEFADELQEEEGEEEQQLDEAKENMTNDIRSAYEAQMTALDAVKLLKLFKETTQEVFIPRYTIDGNRKINIVKFLIRKRLEKYIENRESLLERVYKLKYKTAKKLIDGGYKFLGGFGRWCPVKLHEGEKMPPLYDEENKPFPVIYRNFIYFLSDKLSREKFLRNPIKYLKQKPPQPVTPLKISIVGPPKSGKTTLVNRFCKEYGCMRLSIGEAIRLVLDKQPKTDLAIKVKEHLLKGKTVPDELSIKCLEVATLDVKCQTRGYVLDGFPSTKQQVKYLTDRGLIPVKIIELKCDVKEMLQRGTKDKEAALAKSMVLHSSPEILAYRYKEWKAEVSPIRTWYSNEHKNWDMIDGTLSKWRIWDAARALADKALYQIQSYLTRINQGKAASIANLCVTYEEMLNRLGDFGQYCPVSLAVNAELVDCAANRTMDFVAEYQGHYYKMYSQKELDEFISTPYKYIPPFATRKLPTPDLLPKKRTSSEIKEMMKPIELLGYCPVTFYDGKQRYEAIERGNQEYAAEYKNKIYTMVSEEAREKFMRKPELYSAQKLPHKLPPLKEPMNVLNLPMLGYLEQSTSEILIKALHGVGTFKPKFPFVSTTRSALLYVAYYLKGYNPKSSEYRRKKYKQKLAYFEENCQLIHFLATKTTIKYKDPSKFSGEFNAKYESFFALQQNVPTMNWLS